MRDGVESLNDRLARLHGEVREYFPFVVRVAVALYDPDTDEIKTFLSSPSEDSPLVRYHVPLSSAGWLDEMRRTGHSRVIDDLGPAVLGDQAHSVRILDAGYKASYTVPIFDQTRLLGFVFFNSDRNHAFADRVTRQLDLFVRIISMMIENELRSVDVLAGSLHLLREISTFRDLETGAHLSRMSYYTEALARGVAGDIGRDDTWVEYMRLFAPLHDIGKIAIPDAILLKGEALTAVEYDLMKQHAVKGAQILTTLIRDLSLDRMQYIDSLRYIARNHHERWDGRGYPDGLSGEAIPAEARIMKIADVFDALTSTRCYKKPWPVERARAFLREGAGTEFDPRFVEIFLARDRTVEEIMRRFSRESSEAT